MTLKDFFVAELEREVERSRRALQNMPDGQGEWKPHDKSMKFEYLAGLVATIPEWITAQVTKDSLDIAPADGQSSFSLPKGFSAAAYVKSLEASAEATSKALRNTTNEHLTTIWQLKVKGAVVMEGPRHQLIQDSFNHWAHHRGQMTVYLRLTGAKVPSLYGPSADESGFK